LTTSPSSLRVRVYRAHMPASIAPRCRWCRVRPRGPQLGLPALRAPLGLSGRGER
jgi:hypothetical protein